MNEFGNPSLEMSRKPGLRDRIRNIGRGCIATVTTAAVLLTGCSGDREPTIRDEHLWKLENVAGGCLIDGIKIRDSYPKPDADGKPSNLEEDWGNRIHVFDTDGIKGNGVQISPKGEVSRNPNQVVCFDIADGEVPFVVTERPDATTRYWYTFSLKELNAPVGNEQHFAMKALIEAARDSGVNNVVVASDGVAVTSTLGNELEVVKA